MKIRRVKKLKGGFAKGGVRIHFRLCYINHTHKINEVCMRLLTWPKIIEYSQPLTWPIRWVTQPNQYVGHYYDTVFTSLLRPLRGRPIRGRVA